MAYADTSPSADPAHGLHVAGAHDAHDAHGHGAHGADHVPHVLPLWLYLATWGALIVLTVATVAASYANFGAWNFIIAIVIATSKACVVAAIFMHLRYDRKFHAIIFSFSVIFLGIFILFTMFDTETRGRTDIVEHDRPINVSTPFTGGGRDEAALKARYEKAAAPEHGEAAHEGAPAAHEGAPAPAPHAAPGK
jgi:cytochrome c oxidase subunit 4